MRERERERKREAEELKERDVKKEGRKRERFKTKAPNKQDEQKSLSQLNKPISKTDEKAHNSNILLLKACLPFTWFAERKKIVYM